MWPIRANSICGDTIASLDELIHAGHAAPVASFAHYSRPMGSGLAMRTSFFLTHTPAVSMLILEVLPIVAAPEDVGLFVRAQPCPIPRRTIGTRTR